LSGIILAENSMNTPILALLVFTVCPILALLFIIRMACAIFSSKPANQIRKHPMLHGIWGCIALFGLFAFITAFTPSNPFDEPRDTISSWCASWYIPPPIQLRPPLRSEHSDFICVATEAPIAVSDGLQIWKLGSLFQGPTPALDLFSAIEVAVISPDGNTIAVASNDEFDLGVADWKNGRILWKTNQLKREGHYDGKHLVIGDDGRMLFAAGAHTIERWDLFSGRNHTILVANNTNIDGVVQLLKISRNGKILIAGFGDPNVGRSKSFAVWDVGKNEPTLKFEEKAGANADISPDGDWIALSRFGTEKLVLFKWRTGERKEVLLQDSHGIYSVLWSPDGKRLAAYVDTSPESIIIYETTNWKPIAHWNCGGDSKFFFGNDGTLYQVHGNELNAFDVSRLKSF
jgi:WD40 repeat protein